MRLTPSQRMVLELASKQALRRIPGVDDWPASPNTLASLVRRELLERSERRNKHGRPYVAWEITETGKLVLNPPPKAGEDVDEYLAPGNGYTSSPSRAVDPLPIMDPSRLKTRWKKDAESKRLGAQDKKAAADRAVKVLRAA